VINPTIVFLNSLFTSHSPDVSWDRLIKWHKEKHLDPHIGEAQMLNLYNFWTLAAHLSCSRSPSSRPGTPGPPKARSDSGQSSRPEEHTAYCTYCYSSCYCTAPGCDRRGEPLAHRAGWSAIGRRGWSSLCERCVRSAAPPQLKYKPDGDESDMSKLWRLNTQNIPSSTWKSHWISKRPRWKQ